MGVGWGVRGTYVSSIGSRISVLSFGSGVALDSLGAWEAWFSVVSGGPTSSVVSRGANVALENNRDRVSRRWRDGEIVLWLSLFSLPVNSDPISL